MPIHPHNWLEDGYAILISSTLIAFGVMLLHQAGLVTGGTGGAALLLSYHLAYPVMTILFFLNLPFFVFSIFSGGRMFFFRTVLANTSLLLLGPLISAEITISSVNPLFASVFGGSTIGLGILALIRHGAGIGGIGVIALFLQKIRGWNSGRTQLFFDVLIVGASFPFLDTGRFLLSILSAVVLNSVVMVNHRRGRYMTY